MQMEQHISLSKLDFDDWRAYFHQSIDCPMRGYINRIDVPFQRASNAGVETGLQEQSTRCGRESEISSPKRQFHD